MAGAEDVDLVVVGAGTTAFPKRSNRFHKTLTRCSCIGWHGLAAAKTYLEVNPTSNLVVLEEASTVGGVWAEHRLYPGLKTNNLVGTYEFSDFPLDHTRYGVEEGRPLPGEVVQRYLTDYSKAFGVYQRIRFDCKVESCQRKNGGGWLLNLSGHQMFASKLIIATGLTSDPLLPLIKGAESFEAPLFHSKDFKHNASTVDTSKTVCVLGGAKSAWDVVYAYASRGVQGSYC
jgi:cation diffusion facilitator CzcD-associated flavoprotein CzcO